MSDKRRDELLLDMAFIPQHLKVIVAPQKQGPHLPPEKMPPTEVFWTYLERKPLIKRGHYHGTLEAGLQRIHTRDYPKDRGVKGGELFQLIEDEWVLVAEEGQEDEGPTIYDLSTMCRDCRGPCDEAFTLCHDCAYPNEDRHEELRLERDDN